MYAFIKEFPPARPLDDSADWAGSHARLVGHGLVGWAICMVTMVGLGPLVGATFGAAVRAIAAPVIFVAIAHHYFMAHGAREPLPTAMTWTVTVAVLDLASRAAMALRNLEVFGTVAATWLPLVSIFLATWATGTIMSMRAGIPTDDKAREVRAEAQVVVKELTPVEGLTNRTQLKS